MKRTQSQKRSELLAAAEKAIDELLAWGEATPAPNMTQIEDEVLMLRQRLGEHMAQMIIEEQAMREPVAAPHCSECGKVMVAKGGKRKTTVSRVGTLAIARNHYYCPRCKSGVFPPGQAT